MLADILTLYSNGAYGGMLSHRVLHAVRTRALKAGSSVVRYCLSNICFEGNESL